MHIVVKGTKTIEEFKQKQSIMNNLAIMCFSSHKSAFSNWLEGEPVKVWYDNSENLCIEYQSGRWWHYHFNNYNQPEWW